MKHLILQTSLALLVASNSAWAEIYETTDSEGNTVFTDTPSGAAKVVDLPEANLADGVEVPPTPAAAAPSPAAPTKQPGSQQEDNGVYIIGDQYDDRLESAAIRKRRQEALEPGAPGHNVEGEVIHHKERAVTAPHRAGHHR